MSLASYRAALPRKNLQRWLLTLALGAGELVRLSAQPNGPIAAVEHEVRAGLVALQRAKPDDAVRIADHHGQLERGMAHWADYYELDVVRFAVRTDGPIITSKVVVNPIGASRVRRTRLEACSAEAIAEDGLKPRVAGAVRIVQAVIVVRGQQSRDLQKVRRFSSRSRVVSTSVINRGMAAFYTKAGRP